MKNPISFAVALLLCGSGALAQSGPNGGISGPGANTTVVTIPASGGDDTGAINAALAKNLKIQLNPNSIYNVCGVALPQGGAIFGSGGSTQIFVNPNCAQGFHYQSGSTITVVNGGTGASANDVLTCQGGVVAPTAAPTQIRVQETSGVVTSAGEYTSGIYSSPPTGNISCTGGTGTGATFNITYVAAAFYLANNTVGKVTLKDFFLDGNSANQANPVDSIYYDNAGAASLALKDDFIQNVDVDHTSGTCLDLEYAVRVSFVGPFSAHNCGVNGIIANNSDSQYSSIDVGNTTQAGVIIGGSSQVWGPTKVWYAGGSNTNYDGVDLNSASSITMNDLWTQDNGGYGVSMEGIGSNYAYDIQIHMRSDSDNGAGGSGCGAVAYRLLNSQIQINAYNRSGGAGTPTAAFCFPGNSSGNTHGNDVHALAVGGVPNAAVVSFAVAGYWTGNTVTLDGQPSTFSLPYSTATVTISNASPGVVTWTAHGLLAGQPVVFSTTGALPTGLTAGTIYYVLSAGLTTNTFEVSATQGGAAINTSSAGSGTQTGATALAPNPYAGQTNTSTITGNVTVNAPSLFAGNTPTGLTFCLDLLQDGTGGHAITWTTGAGGFRQTGSTVTTASTHTRACFTFDGVEWNQNSFYSGLGPA